MTSIQSKAHRDAGEDRGCAAGPQFLPLGGIAGDGSIAPVVAADARQGADGRFGWRRGAVWPARPAGGLQRALRNMARLDGPADGGGEAGFTLLEILVVLAILGLLVGLVAPAALRQLGGARISVAKQSIARIGTVLDLYKLDVGSYPSTEDGLDALVHKPASVESWNGPYLKGDAVPKDPWGHVYDYTSPSSREGHDYDLCSAGPHGTGSSPGQGEAICNP